MLDVKRRLSRHLKDKTLKAAANQISIFSLRLKYSLLAKK